MNTRLQKAKQLKNHTKAEKHYKIAMKLINDLDAKARNLVLEDIHADTLQLEYDK